MNKPHKRAILRFCAVYICMATFGAWQGFATPADTLVPIRHFTYENGLPTKNVYNLTRDQNGFIWLASQNGVFRFDGKNFYPYTPKEGLCDNEIIEIFVDSRNVVWCTGFNGRVSFIENGVVNPGNSWINDWEANQHIKDIVEDSRGNLYMAGEGGDIYRLDANRRLTGKHKFVNVISMSIYKDTLCVFAGYDYLEYSIRDGYRQVERSSNKFNVGTLLRSHTQNGMWDYTSKERVFNKTTHNDINLKAYNNEQLVYVLELDERYVVLSFGVGKAVLYDFRTKRFFPIKLPSTAMIVDAVKDRDNNVWLSGYNGGFFCVELPEKKQAAGYLPGFAKNIVNSLKEGNTIHAVTNSGELIMDDGTQTKSRYVYQKGWTSRSIMWDNVFFKRLQNRLLLVNEQAIFDIGTNPFRSFKPAGKDMQVYGDTLLFINQGLLASEGTIDVKNPTLTDNPRNRKTIVKERTFAIALQGDTLWISTQQGLCAYDIRSGTLGPSVYKAPNGGRIEKLLPWKYGLLLLATSNNGVVVFNGKRAIANVRTENGLFSDDCKEIDLWRRGWLLRHAYGMSLVDVYSARISTISRWQGMPILSVNNVGVYGDTVMLSTRMGLFRVGIDSLFKLRAEPRRVTFVQVMSGSRRFEPQNVALAYDENRLKIVFSLPEFNTSQQVQYRWRLNGDSWNDLSTNTLEFATLDAGEYHLELKGKASDHEWTQPSELVFTVATPFWQTGWFWTGIGIALLLGGWAIQRTLYRRKLATEREKASVRYQLMDFEQKALNAMMNPHFVFNAMGSIQHLLNTGQNQQANDYLVKFSRLIRKSLETSQLEFCYLDDEIERLTLYLQLEKMRFGGRMDFSIDVADDVDAEQVKIPTMILQTYVENAIIHGAAALRGEAWVKLVFARNGEGLAAYIEDNGPGFDVNNKAKRSVRFGVSATEKRLELLTQITGKPYGVHIVSPASAEGGTRVELLFSIKE